MTPDTAAARLALALRPGARTTGQRAFVGLAVYTTFAREVHAEAGADVLADIVRTVERHAVLGRRAAA